MQDSEKLTREEIIAEYKEDAMKLLKYLSWFKNHETGISDTVYSGEGIEEHSMTFPVYDSTLLGFIKEVQKTKFLNQNYVYTFSKYQLKTSDDEKAMIAKCTLRDIKILGDILSKYVLKGMVKSTIWNEGANNGIYLCVLLKIKEILEIHKL